MAGTPANQKQSLANSAKEKLGFVSATSSSLSVKTMLTSSPSSEVCSPFSIKAPSKPATPTPAASEDADGGEKPAKPSQNEEKADTAAAAEASNSVKGPVTPSLKGEKSKAAVNT